MFQRADGYGVFIFIYIVYIYIYLTTSEQWNHSSGAREQDQASSLKAVSAEEQSCKANSS